LQRVMARGDLDLGRIGEAIMLRRRRLGLEQKDVAERSGLERTYISRVENGRVLNPKIGDLNRIATALDANLADFLGGSESLALDAELEEAFGMTQADFAQFIKGKATAEEREAMRAFFRLVQSRRNPRRPTDES
jgi:transcriptional regulator with XRE-family HTH domain